MNQAQVSKVVHEAIRALKQTQNQDAGEPYEQLNDHQRSSHSAEMGAYASGTAKGQDFGKVAENIPEDKKLEAYIANGIVSAFHQYEQGQKGSNTLDASGVHDATAGVNKDAVDADNALARQNAPEPKLGASENIQDAMAKADGGIEEHNK